MRSSIRKSLALLVAGFGMSAGIAFAEPKTGTAAKTETHAKADPKTADPKPTAKVDPKPVVVDPKLPVLPKVDPKPVIKPEPKIILPTIDPKLLVKTPDAKLPTVPVVHPLVIHEKPKTGTTEMPKGPGLKLPAGTKVDHAELAKIKPPIDLTKTKPEAVLASKPAADFKVKPVKLESIHIPKDSPVVEKLSMTTLNKTTVNQNFIVNKNFYTAGDYHLKFGTKASFGYIYPGKWHSHWHHCIWDPCFQCNYFFCPSTCCYYYWCEVDYCYYPCHWFVDYGTMYYPWWICGGFGGYGYVAQPTISIYIGW
ncbi:MAG TPA: hypothetical protein VHR66_16980 [Gemmataceae bacterium]|jgi:hypothetical protein|nr:hypothetical protein [Gemmataceae bacterium]